MVLICDDNAACRPSWHRSGPIYRLIFMGPAIFRKCLPAIVCLVAGLLAWPFVVPAAAAFDDRSLRVCSAVGDDRQRLACYDSLVARSPKPEHQPPAARVASAPAEAAPEPAAVAAATGPGLRIAAGYGYGVGDHSGTFRVLSGDLKLQSAAGNSGDMVSGQLWIDNWIGENWTFGLEYVAFRNEGKLRVTLPKGLSILTDPVEAGARDKVSADLGFLNLAWRQASGSVHPFIGGGLGIGYGHASAWYDFENAFLGKLSQDAAVGKPIAGVQGFLGVEFDLGDHGYLAVMPRVIVLDAHPIGIDQQFMDFGVDGVLGWRF